MWVALALVSAFLLGVYDVFKKISLKDNAVIPVLTASIFISAVLFLPILFLSKFYPQSVSVLGLYLPELEWGTHVSLL